MQEVMQGGNAARYSAPRTVLWTASLVMAVSLADRSLIGPLLPLIIKQFHITDVTAGAIVSLFFGGYFLATTASGWISDRFGRRRIIVVGLIGFGLATGVTGLATAVWMLVLWRLVVGLFEGACYPTSAAWVGETHSWSTRAASFGFYSLIGNVGAAVGVVAGAVIGQLWGWRAPWIIFVVPTLILAWIVARKIREQPRGTTPAHQEVVESGTPTQARWGSIFRIRNTWVGMILGAMSATVTWGMSAWMPLYLVKVQHAHLIGAGLTSAFFFVGLGLGNATSGRLADRIGRRQATALWAGLAIPTLILFLSLHNIWLLVLCGLLVGFFGNGWLSNVMALVSDSVTPNLMGSIISMVVLGQEIGAISGPLLGGIIAQHYGLSRALLIYGSFYAITVGIVWLARDMKGGKPHALSSLAASKPIPSPDPSL